jgi:N-acyl-L-homoserine lactone synthetase
MGALQAVSTPSSISNPSLTDRVLALLERVDYQRAETAEDRDTIYRLRYQAYLKEGAIEPNPSERFLDKYDESPNCMIFGVYVDGELASSIRLHVASREYPEMPALGVFSDLLLPTLNAGKTIIDPTRFVADKALSRRFPEISYVATRLGWLACEYFRTHLVLATVREEHQAFYRRVFGHRAVCEPRHYPSLTKPISLMALDYMVSRERVMQARPFFRSTFFERRMLFGRTPAAVPMRTAA